MVTCSDGFYHSFSSLEGGGSLASSSSSSSSGAAPRAIFSESCSENSFTPWRYSASAFQFPSPDIMLLVEPEPPFDLDADPLDVARAGEDLRADGRDFEEDDFEDEAFDDDAFEEERDFEEARDFDGRDFDGRDFDG